MKLKFLLEIFLDKESLISEKGDKLYKYYINKIFSSL